MYDVNDKHRSSGSTGRHNFGGCFCVELRLIPRNLLMTQRLRQELSYVWISWRGIPLWLNSESGYVRDMRGA